MTEQPQSREEFHMLRAAIADNARRIEQTQTTANGIAVLSTQLAEVIKDVATVALDQQAHAREHQAERASRTSARRWAIATGVAALAAVEAPLAYLIGHVR